MAAIDHEMVMAAQGPSELWRVNPTPRFQHPQWMWDPIAFEFYPNDLELARYLVERSDYDGRVIRFMHQTDWVNPMRTGSVGQELMRDIGLNVELITVDTATFLSLWTQFGQWDIKSSAGGSEVTASHLDAASRSRDRQRWPRGLTLLEEPCDDLAEILLQLVQRGGLGVRPGETGHVGHEEASVRAAFDDGREGAHAGSLRSAPSGPRLGFTRASACRAYRPDDGFSPAVRSVHPPTPTFTTCTSSSSIPRKSSGFAV